MTARKRLLFAACALVLVLVTIETASWIFFRSQQDNYTFYDVSRHALDDDDLQKLKAYFHPGLGWKKPYATTWGERPREIEYPATLLATFGDSYTHCDEVEDDETWQTHLSRSTRMNVFNFGNGGYGTDQAYLRFREDYPNVNAPVVSLGLTSDNIKRVVNVYRKFFYRKTGIPATKPRFVLDGTGLRLLPNPIRSIDELRRLKDLTFLDAIGRNDLWYNKNEYPALEFPYSGILFNRSFWLEVKHGKLGNDINDIDPRPWIDLWDDEESREIMFRIFDRFVRDARSLDAAPIIMILPKKKEVLHLFRTGRHRAGIRMILDYARRRGYEVFDGIAALRTAAHNERRISTFFDGHLSPAGNALIAQRLLQHLEEHGHLERVHGHPLGAGIRGVPNEPVPGDRVPSSSNASTR